MYYKHFTKLYEKLQYLIAEPAKYIPSDAESGKGSSEDGEHPTKQAFSKCFERC